MFEKLKRRIQEKIEKNAIKSNLNWTDSEGNIHAETVYLKRSKVPFIGDWARIYPPVNEDGTWNITNLFFGGKKNLIQLILVAIVVAMVLAGFYEQFQNIETLRNLPCVQSCLNPIQ